MQAVLKKDGDRPMSRWISWIAAGILTAGVSGGVAVAGDTRLVDAVRSGNTAAVRSLIASKVNVNAPSADSSTPLHWAVEQDDFELANMLIDAGADVNAKTRYNITPLALACTNGN